MEKMKIFDWVLRLVAAVILLQTLYYKFSAAPESVFIFESLGLEPYGRIGIGVLELIAGVLLLVPRTAGIGAILSLGIISGAIFSHLTQLGIEVQGDGGLLFILAVIVFVCTLIVAYLRRKEIPIVNRFF